MRVNTLKISRNDLKKRLEKNGITLQKVPWFQDAFFVEGTKNLGRMLEHFLGYFFVQDASSLLPPIVLAPKAGEMVLDLCAAPGAKTTQMAQMMQNQGIIFANESKIKRISILKGNLQRCGVMNTVLTHFDARIFWQTKLKFEKILIDAPCSGSGTFISNPSIFGQLSEGLIKKLVHLQKTILASAFFCLKEGGTIVYSTCSLDPRENEEVIDWAMKKFKFQIEEIKV
ncbi:MAG: NOL1/NOP2/sun family putative RNA methylase, partial [Minisyncoccales bacterium]